MYSPEEIARHESAHAVFGSLHLVQYEGVELTADGGRLAMPATYFMTPRPAAEWAGFAVCCAAGPFAHATMYMGGHWLTKAREFASAPDLRLIDEAKAEFLKRHPDLADRWPRDVFVVAANDYLFRPGIEATVKFTARLLQARGRLDRRDVDDCLGAHGLKPAPYPLVTTTAAEAFVGMGL